MKLKIFSRVLFLSVSFIAIMVSQAFATSQPVIPNIKLEGDILSWDAFEDENLDHYSYTISSGGGRIEKDGELQINLRETLESFKDKSDDYTIKLQAEDSSYQQISAEWQGVYHYESIYPQLATPDNIRWDGMIAKWNEVENATSYSVHVCQKGYYCFSVYPSTNSYDFSNDIRLVREKEYSFYVEAEATQYPTSEPSDMSMSTYGWFEKGDLSNVSISEDGILSWNAYEGATDYMFLMGPCGGSTIDTSVNLKEMAEEFGFDTGDYNVSLYAMDAESNELSKAWTGIYHYEKSSVKLGDLDKDDDITILDVRLLLQAYINAGSSPSWTASDLATMDMNHDETIDILDVRLLLQAYINK